jgi:hypothetical protein
VETVFPFLKAQKFSVGRETFLDQIQASKFTLTTHSGSPGNSYNLVCDLRLWALRFRVCICSEKENIWCQQSAPHGKAVQFPLSTDTFWHVIKMPVLAWKARPGVRISCRT